jgi:hypothetical protein
MSYASITDSFTLLKKEEKKNNKKLKSTNIKEFTEHYVPEKNDINILKRNKIKKNIKPE